MQNAARLVAIGLIFIYFAGFYSASSQEKPDIWPQRVLITNDNGIDDIKIIELARAFSRIAETYVIAPSENRSGSTNFMTIFAKRSIQVQTRSLGLGIKAYSVVDGYPADCVILGVCGIMAENPPDLIVSGINGGPNLDLDWFGSGTIGAARTAALCGLPAIAVSGLNDSIQQCIEAATAWVVELAQSELVHKLEFGQYLTVSLPRKVPSKIKGIKVVKRAPPSGRPVFMKNPKAELGLEWQEWMLKNWEVILSAPEDSDVAVYDKDFIVIVPMQVDENDERFYTQVLSRTDKIPVWPTSANKKEVKTQY